MEELKASGIAFAFATEKLLSMMLQSSIFIPQL